MRPSGTAALTAAWVAGSSARAIIGVKTGPGCRQFTRIPYCAYSTAATFVIIATTPTGQHNAPGAYGCAKRSERRLSPRQHIASQPLVRCPRLHRPSRRGVPCDIDGDRQVRDDGIVRASVVKQPASAARPRLEIMVVETVFADSAGAGPPRAVLALLEAPR